MSRDLILKNVSVALNNAPLFTIDAAITPGTVLSVMGPSGSGKSTLINAIAGFLPKSFSLTGQALLKGRDLFDLPAEHRKVGVLFQDPLLFPHLSVMGNILFAVPRVVKGAERLRRAQALLAAVNLEDCADRDPATLSGGQQARVALVRVLASEPEVLLLDEPFSKLDAELRASVRKLVCDEIEKRALPAILVTHDQQDADAAGGAIISLSC